MSVASPSFLWVAAGASFVTVALHLLAWRRPPESPLPTARFAPEAPIRIASRAIRPSDLALLALRVVLLMLVGVGLAGPSFVSRSPGVGRVLVIDRSRGGSANAVIAEASRPIFRPGDALVVFDSAAREVANASPDSIASEPTTVRGALSAALITGIRAARRLERSHDSVEIVVVSSFGGDELDASTRAIRATWPGPLRLVRVGSQPNDSSALARPEVRAAIGDPVSASLALAGDVRGGATVRVARDSVTEADSAWARRGGTLVAWPALAAPSTWPRRTSADTAWAVTLLGSHDSADEAGATVVARFPRRAAPPPGAVVARWADGEPAVTEASLGSGCVRSVAVVVPMVGDLPLTTTFRRFASAIAAPCNRSVTWHPASDSALANALPASLSQAATETPAEPRAPVSESSLRLAVWLLGAALVVAGVELLVRRGAARATA